MKQTVVPVFQASVESQGPTRLLVFDVVVETPLGAMAIEKIVFPMDSAPAEELGKALSAPSVHIGTPADLRDINGKAA